MPLLRTSRGDPPRYQRATAPLIFGVDVLSDDGPSSAASSTECPPKKGEGPAAGSTSEGSKRIRETDVSDDLRRIELSQSSTCQISLSSEWLVCMSSSRTGWKDK